MDFRNYDPTIGRFHNSDLLAEMAPDWSPYRFAFNNPVVFSDPTGLEEEGRGNDGGPGDTEINILFDKDAKYIEFRLLGWDVKMNVPEGGPDPEGKSAGNAPPDDHFDQFGNFMYTDDAETNNIIIHTPIGPEIPNIGQPTIQTQLKDYYFSESNFSTLTNIAAYYASFAGVDVSSLHNGSFSVGAFTENKSEGGQTYGSYKFFNNGNYGGLGVLMNADSSNQTISIMVRNGYIMSSLLNNKYNMISNIYHEGSAGGHLGMPNASHSTIYRNQIKHSTFQATTEAYKTEMIKNYRRYGGK